MTTASQQAGRDVAYRIGYGDLAQPLTDELQRQNATAMHGAFVRMAAEKIGEGNLDWFSDFPTEDRDWLVGTLEALGDSTASRVAAAVREMEAR